ncbi:MAG TPA: NAD(P)/FAD-dependent oxidoreductase [Ignavibacteriaceae bacterium]|nr:NAD(P)/FAD-dependent oxidoreductase [Ignavibacteriaceae bacterium]
MYEHDFYKVIVIGAGQAGLSVGYYLSKAGIPFLILDANERVGDSWRKRWDSLRLFTPSKFDRLAGLPFPASPNYFPTKDEMGDYLETYAAHFKIPVRTGVKVTGLTKEGDIFCLNSTAGSFLAENVVIAMSDFQVSRIPKFASELKKDIVQLHSLEYRNSSQLQDGDVLIVGAGNSGAEISLEVARNNHKVYLSGRDTGHIPFNIEGTLSKLILARVVLRVLFHRIFTTSTPVGRKLRPKLISAGGPLIRINPDDFTKAGIIRVPRVTGVSDGLPVLENNQKLNVKNVIWCTGFNPSFSWIDLPVFKNKELMQTRGIVEKMPGLYFTGLHFLYSFSSTMVHGAARDAAYIVKNIREKRIGVKPEEVRKAV